MWLVHRNRTDRRAARSHVTVLAGQERSGAVVKRSPKMRHGVDDRPRLSVLLRQQRRAMLAQGYDEQAIAEADRLVRTVSAAGGIRAAR